MRQSVNAGLLAALFGAALLIGATQAPAGELEDAAAARARGDHAGALRLLRPLAEKGNAVAQHNVGVSYFRGDGAPKDLKEAEKWFRLAAGQGHLDAQSTLGVMKLMSKDYMEALKWVQLSAERGAVSSQVNLGIMYYEGQGVARDPVRAHMWMHLAALGGDANAANYRDEIASKLSQAQVEQSLKLAKEWQPK